ncbi:MAG: hypothetical protein JXA97_13165 [Anaerolineales bacterium]|nr:hypothetical protein [Anaerolineales bacterium]
MDETHIDASKIMASHAPLDQLIKLEKIRSFQGDPIGTAFYQLPDFNPKTISPIASLGVCLIQFQDDSSWALAQSRHDVDPWEITAAFVRLGYFPPLQLIDQLTKSPNLTAAEANEVIQIVLEVITPRIQNLIEIRTNLLKIKQALRW